jgi:hypothetical protein
MRVMVIIKATPNSEAGIMPSEQLLSDMGNFNEELVKAGTFLMTNCCMLSTEVLGKRQSASYLRRREMHCIISEYCIVLILIAL